MAILPQIDNSINAQVETLDVQLPSKTYKLILTNNDEAIYSSDSSNIVIFRFIDYNLIGIPQSENRTVNFEIDDGDFIVIDDNQALLDRFSIEENYLYLESDFYGDRIIGYVDNLEAIKQAIYHILSIERYAYSIYDDNYGVELDQYIGKDIDYVRTTIEETLREALTHDLRINDIRINSFNVIDNDSVAVNFTAITIYGDLVLEVNINV